MARREDSSAIDALLSGDVAGSGAEKIRGASASARQHEHRAVIRIVHSLLQTTVNIIPIRFLIFMTGSVVLIALAVHAAIAVGFVHIDLPHQG